VGNYVVKLLLNGAGGAGGGGEGGGNHGGNTTKVGGQKLPEHRGGLSTAPRTQGWKESVGCYGVKSLVGRKKHRGKGVRKNVAASLVDSKLIHMGGFNK